MVFTSVDQSLLGPFNSSLGATAIGLGRNRVINGEMAIDQANGGNALVLSGGGTQYSVDQFQGLNGTAGGLTIQRQSGGTLPTSQFFNYLRATVTSADSSPAATAYAFIEHLIEGYNVRDFGLGTSAPKTFTLSFWVRSSITGTFSVAFLNSGDSRSYATTYNYNVANTWQFVSITLTGDNSGTWQTFVSTGLKIVWDLGMGTNRQTSSANTWGNGQIFSVTGSTRLISTNGATMDITGVQCELGSTATPFEFRFFQLELQLCQRYYEKSYGRDINPGSNNPNTVIITATQFGATSTQGYLPWKITKRSAPTVTFYTQTGTSGQLNWISTGGTSTARATTAPNAIDIGTYVRQTTSTDVTAEGHWVADARLA